MVYMKNFTAVVGMATFALLTQTSVLRADLFCDPICESPPSSFCFTDIHPLNHPCGNWFAELDLLCWHPSGCGLGFAIEDTFRQTSADNLLTKTKVHNLHFSWDAGVRVGLGFVFNAGWELEAYWTHFKGRGSGEVHVGPFERSGKLLFVAYGTLNGISQPGIIPLRVPLANNISSDWALRLDVADFRLAYDYCPTSCLRLRPYLGIKAAWIEQTMHIDATAPNPFSFLAHSIQNVKLKTDFKGAGASIGMDAECDLGCGWGLYGNAGLSILLGRGKSYSSEENTVILGPAFERTPTTQKDSWLGCRPITDLELGLQYRDWYCCDTVALILAIGWEHHLFFNTNRFEDFVNKVPVPAMAISSIQRTSRSQQFTRGDLCVQGFTFSARLEF